MGAQRLCRECVCSEMLWDWQVLEFEWHIHALGFSWNFPDQFHVRNSRRGGFALDKIALLPRVAIALASEYPCQFDAAVHEVLFTPARCQQLSFAGE